MIWDYVVFYVKDLEGFSCHLSRLGWLERDWSDIWWKGCRVEFETYSSSIVSD